MTATAMGEAKRKRIAIAGSSANISREVSAAKEWASEAGTRCPELSHATLTTKEFGRDLTLRCSDAAIEDSTVGRDIVS